MQVEFKKSHFSWLTIRTFVLVVLLSILTGARERLGLLTAG